MVPFTKVKHILLFMQVNMVLQLSYSIIWQVSPSVRNGIGETKISRWLFKIEGWICWWRFLLPMITHFIIYLVHVGMSIYKRHAYKKKTFCYLKLFWFIFFFSLFLKTLQRFYILPSKYFIKIYGSGVLNPGAAFLRFVTEGFLIFLTPAGGPNPVGPIF